MAHKVLVVDDEEKIAQVLEKFLRKQGYDVTSVGSAGKAIELLKAGGAFDLMITDMKMPGLTGLELLKEKKRLGIGIPTILLTGSIDVEKYCETQDLSGLGIGLEEICYKPVDLFKLLEMVRAKIKGGE